MVGISGIAGERAGAATPRPRSFPALTWTCATGITRKATCVSPEITLIDAGAAPLYGRCWARIPVRSRSSSIAMCDMVPAPAEAASRQLLKEQVQNALSILTDREREVLRLIAIGKDNAEIARELFISPKTVKNHISNILMKLQIENRIQAAVYAVRSGLV